jgi:hypothetical protein
MKGHERVTPICGAMETLKRSADVTDRTTVYRNANFDCLWELKEGGGHPRYLERPATVRYCLS